MSKYNNILNLFSLTLVLIILFIVMYGCQFRNHNHRNKIEKFTDIQEEENSNQEEENSNQEEDNSNQEEDNSNQEEETKYNLNENEEYLLEQFLNDNINDVEINKLILDGKFTEKNLENMIKYVEKFSNEVKDKIKDKNKDN